MKNAIGGGHSPVHQINQDGAAEVGKSHNKSRFTGYGPDTDFHLSTGTRYI